MLEDMNPPEKDKRLFGWFPHLGRDERQELAGRIADGFAAIALMYALEFASPE